MKILKRTIGKVYREVFVHKVARKYHTEHNFEHFNYLSDPF